MMQDDILLRGFIDSTIIYLLILYALLVDDEQT